MGCTLWSKGADLFYMKNAYYHRRVELENNLSKLIFQWGTRDYIESRKKRNWNLFDSLTIIGKLECRIHEAFNYNKKIL